MGLTGAETQAEWTPPSCIMTTPPPTTTQVKRHRDALVCAGDRKCPSLVPTFRDQHFVGGLHKVKIEHIWQGLF